MDVQFFLLTVTGSASLSEGKGAGVFKQLGGDGKGEGWVTCPADYALPTAVQSGTGNTGKCSGKH